MTAVLLWLFSEELQASPVKPSFQSGSKNVDVSKPQQVSSYHAQFPHFQPEHRAKTRHKIKVVRYRLDPWSQIWLKSEVESYHVDPDSHVPGHQLEPQQQAQAIRHQAAPQFQAQRQIQPNEGTNQGGSKSRSLVVESDWGQFPFQPQKRPYVAEPQNPDQLFSYQTEPQNPKESLQPAPHILVQRAPYQLEPMTQTKELFYLNKHLSQMASIQAEPQIQVQGKPNQIKTQTQVQGQSYEVAPQTKLISFQTDPQSQVHGLSYQAQLQSQGGSFHTEPKIQDQVLPYQGDHQMATQGMSYQEDPQSQMTSCQAEPEIQTKGAIYQVEPQSQVASLQMEPHFQAQDLLYQAEHQTPAAREVSYKIQSLLWHQQSLRIKALQLPHTLLSSTSAGWRLFFLFFGLKLEDQSFGCSHRLTKRPRSGFSERCAVFNLPTRWQHLTQFEWGTSSRWSNDCMLPKPGVWPCGSFVCPKNRLSRRS
ncbi:uncharacterized protein LOC101160043 isoform X2 [Oryzias latipes]